MVKDLKQEMKSHKDKLMQSHRVRKRLDSMQETARKLVGCCRGWVTYWESPGGPKALCGPGPIAGRGLRLGATRSLS